jgi:shikimate dehydrogenase
MDKSAASKQCAVIGHPISHSASPAMHNKAYKDADLDFSYVAIDVHPDELGATVDSFKAQGLRGFNVTVPHKEKIIPFLDEIDPLAAAIGAVNTVVNVKGHWVGYNTDGLGFLHALVEDLGFDCCAKKVAVIGAGGAARALCFTVLKAGCSALFVLNRTKQRAADLCRDLANPKANILEMNTQSSYTVLSDCDLVINTSSVGMSPDRENCPLSSMAWVSDKQCVVDIIYNPKETLFLKEARSRGARISNGAGMLAGQGMIAFEYFTGQATSYKVMKGEVEKHGE